MKDPFEQMILEAGKLSLSESRTSYYHITQQDFGPEVKFTPRVPFHISVGEPRTPRVCVSSTIEGSLIALRGVLGVWGPTYVYKAEEPFEVVEPEKVYDFKVTGEMWIVEPVVFKKVSTFVLGNILPPEVLASYTDTDFYPLDNNRENNIKKEIAFYFTGVHPIYRIPVAQESLLREQDVPEVPAPMNFDLARDKRRRMRKPSAEPIQEKLGKSLATAVAAGILGMTPGASIQRAIPVSPKSSYQQAIGDVTIDIDRLADIESSQNPKAVNPKTGARGLLQIMKPTWEEVTNKLGVNWSWDEAFDEEKNEEVGNYYINVEIPRLLKYFSIEDTIEHRLAAYNWGIGDLKKYGLKNAPEETKNYIQRYRGVNPVSDPALGESREELVLVNLVLRTVGGIPGKQMDKVELSLPEEVIRKLKRPGGWLSTSKIEGIPGEVRKKYSYISLYDSRDYNDPILGEALAAVSPKEVIHILTQEYGKDHPWTDLEKSTYPGEEKFYKFFILPNGGLIPVEFSHENAAEEAGIFWVDLGKSGVVFGTLNPDGKEIAVQTYKTKFTEEQISRIKKLVTNFDCNFLALQVGYYNEPGERQYKSSFDTFDELDYLLRYGEIVVKESVQSLKEVTTDSSSIRILLSNSDFTAVIDKGDYPKVSKYRWFLKKDKRTNVLYVATSVRHGEYVETIRLHRLIMNAGPGEDVHHKDFNPLNNKKENLEVLPREEHKWRHSKYQQVVQV